MEETKITDAEFSEVLPTEPTNEAPAPVEPSVQPETTPQTPVGEETKVEETLPVTE